MRTRTVVAPLLAGLLVVSALPAAAATYITLNIPVDVDKLDPTVTSVSCACFLRGPSSGAIPGPVISSMGSSTNGTVTGASFHGTLTSTLGDGNALIDAFLRAEEVECRLNLHTSGGIELQLGSTAIPAKTGPAAPAPNTTFRPKISIPLQ